MLLLRVCLLTVVVVVARGRVYNRLFEDLLGRYNRLIRPSEGPNDTVRIAFRLKLSDLTDVHERTQVVTTNGWLIHRWFDSRLSWSPSLYGNISLMHVPGELLWLPDIILYNNAHGSPHVSAITKAEVRYDGRVTWTPPVVYNSMCKINVEWFPYDEQYCDMKFGSWTYAGSQLDLIHLMADEVVEVQTPEGIEWTVERGIDISEYQESVEFDLLSVVGKRHEKYYPCCDYPSIDITYYLNIRRKKLFYTVNLVTPCFGLATLTSFVFYLPCESHQKLQLCISILVSLAVFFLVLLESIPPTSLCIPLIGKYLVFTMLMVTASVIMTVVVHNIHFRLPHQKVPEWVRRVFIDGIGSRLFISRTVREHRRKEKTKKKMTALNAMMILEKQFNKTLFHLEMATRERNQEMSTTQQLLLKLPFAQRSLSVRTTKQVKTEKSQTITRQSSTDKSIFNVNRVSQTEQDEATRRLRRAERNVHYIAQTLVERRTVDENIADWHFLSLVIDRLLLVLFALLITIGSAGILLSAPSIRDDRKPINVYPSVPM
ncbi:hypothetical protein PMAYCL1PPCAC_24505, partial [Pristionchus mayeri]